MALRDSGRARLGSTELATRLSSPKSEVRSPAEPSADAVPARREVRPPRIVQRHLERPGKPQRLSLRRARTVNGIEAASSGGGSAPGQAGFFTRIGSLQERPASCCLHPGTGG